jgi:hypothetical protein
VRRRGTGEDGDSNRVLLFWSAWGRFGTDLAAVCIAWIDGDERWGFLEEVDLVVGIAVDVEAGDAAGKGVGSIRFEAEDLRIVAGLMADVGGFQDAEGKGPGVGLGEIGAETGVALVSGKHSSSGAQISRNQWIAAKPPRERFELVVGTI